MNPKVGIACTRFYEGPTGRKHNGMNFCAVVFSFSRCEQWPAQALDSLMHIQHFMNDMWKNMKEPSRSLNYENNL